LEKWDNKEFDEKRKEGWGIDTYTYIANLGIDAT